MNRTPDEVKNALVYCNTFNNCQNCPYDKEGEGWGCTVARNADALAYIKQLEDHIRDLTKKVQGWHSPKDYLPDAPVFIGVSRFNPDPQLYRKHPNDPEYTISWLNIRNDILYWMPIPDAPKGASV